MAHPNGNGNGASQVGWSDSRLDLSSRVAVVTGGTGGIGRATCIQLAREGALAIACVDFSENVQLFAHDVNDRLGREAIIPFRGDVTDADFRKQVFGAMEQRFGVVSVCVPAAAVTRDKLAVRINSKSGEADIYSEEEFRRVLEIDLTAPIYWAVQTIASVARDRFRRGVKKWEPREGTQGAIIFIGSVSSAGNRGQISYATCKAGLEGAQATLSTEAIYYGVRCAIIHPGYTDTPMVRSLGEEFIQERILPQTQLRRLIQPEEIAHAIVFMVRNSAVSGRLWADAGWHPAV